MIRFLVDERILVNHYYIQNNLNWLRPITPLLQQTFSSLGYLGTAQNKVLEIGHFNNLSYIRLLPVDPDGNPNIENMAYNKGLGTVIYFNSDLQLNNTFTTNSRIGNFQETPVISHCMNEYSATIFRGYACRHLNYDPQSGCCTMVPSVININNLNEADCTGVALEDIPSGSTGNFLLQGLLRDLDTTGSRVGDDLFVGEVPGMLRNVPGLIVSKVGSVMSIGLKGSIYVRPSITKFG